MVLATRDEKGNFLTFFWLPFLSSNKVDGKIFFEKSTIFTKQKISKNVLEIYGNNKYFKKNDYMFNPTYLFFVTCPQSWKNSERKYLCLQCF